MLTARKKYICVSRNKVEKKHFNIKNVMPFTSCQNQAGLYTDLYITVFECHSLDSSFALNNHCQVKKGDYETFLFCYFIFLYLK